MWHADGSVGGTRVGCAGKGEDASDFHALLRSVVFSTNGTFRR
jgi:hypothetical protein